MNNEKMSFNKWLEVAVGITREYMDNNYEDPSELYDAYNEYLDEE